MDGNPVARLRRAARVTGMSGRPEGAGSPRPGVPCEPDDEREDRTAIWSDEEFDDGGCPPAPAPVPVTDSVKGIGRALGIVESLGYESLAEAWAGASLPAFGRPSRASAEPYVVIQLRRDRDDDQPEVDPARGNVASQERLVASWRRIWAEGTTSPPVSPVPDLPAPVRRAIEHELDWGARVGRWRGMQAARACHLPVRGSHEHVHEDGARLEAAAAAGLPFYAVGGSGNEVLRHGTDIPLVDRLMAGSCVALWWSGSWLAPHPLQVRVPASSMERVSWKYWEFKSFVRCSGRKMEVCMFGDLPGVLARMSGVGHVRAFVKAAEPKVGVWNVELPQGCSTAAAARIAAGAIGIDMEACAAKGFLVQGYVPFHDEMRFFVVGGLIREAVPVRRGDTVHERTPGPGRIDPRTCLSHDGAPSVPDRARAAAYARAARRVIASMSGEVPRGDYVLDMGTGFDGEILPIEINCIARSGMYAADARRILRGMAMEASRGVDASHRSSRETARVLDRAISRLSP